MKISSRKYIPNGRIRIMKEHAAFTLDHAVAYTGTPRRIEHAVITFIMDGRRYRMELDRAEALDLHNRLSGAFKAENHDA